MRWKGTQARCWTQEYCSNRTLGSGACCAEAKRGALSHTTHYQRHNTPQLSRKPLQHAQSTTPLMPVVCSRKQSRILVAAEILFCPGHAVDVPWSMNKNNTLRQSMTTLLKTQQHTGIQIHYMTLFKPAIRLHCLVKLQLSTRNSLLNCRTVHNQPGTTPRPMQPTQRLPESSEAAKLASASAYSGKSSLCQTKCQTIHRDHKLCCCRLLDGFTADPGIHTPPRGGHWI